MGANIWTSAELEALARESGVEPVVEPAALAAAAGDFGHLSRGRCQAVLRPTTADEVAAIMRFANERRLGVTIRGAGNSQSGQSIALDTISLDLRGLRKIETASGGDTARCDAGASFRELADACAAVGRQPRVMPLNLDLSVGGVLSAGGFGSTSHQEGLVVSTVRTVEVVLGSGDRAIGTPLAGRSIWDAVLGGAGRFGVITAAELALRPLAKQVRTYFLFYDNLETFLEDQLRLVEDRRCDHLEGFCSAAISGFRKQTSGRRAPFARWFFVLHVGFCHDGEPLADRVALAGLRHRELLHVEDSDAREHAARYDVRFAGMKAIGAWEQAHPWAEFLLPARLAHEIVADVLAELPLFLGDGHRLSLLALAPEGGASPALLMAPPERSVVAFAVLPVGVATPLLPSALETLHRLHDRLLSLGAKRYISGWLFEPDETAWRAHFGPQFAQWEKAKRTLDPNGVLRSSLDGSLIPSR